MKALSNMECGRYCIIDWMKIHNIKFEKLKYINSIYFRKYINYNFWNHYKSDRIVTISPIGDLFNCLKLIIYPAFLEYFGEFIRNESLNNHIIFENIDFDNLHEPPHTIDLGVGRPPKIVMPWRNRPEDIVCLAHEVAHALQIHLSNHEFMPPMARETCAFIGELMLLTWAAKNRSDLAVRLDAVWRSENRSYLIKDGDNLLAALQYPNAPYNYRMNYPLARLMAIELFATAPPQRILGLFRSGSQAMRELTLNEFLSMERGNGKSSSPVSRDGLRT